MLIHSCPSCAKPVPDGTNICPFCGFFQNTSLDDDVTVINEDIKQGDSSDTVLPDHNDGYYSKQSYNNNKTNTYGDRQNSPYNNGYNQPQNNYTPSYSNPKNEKSNSKTLGIILSLAVALVIIFVLIVYLSNVRSDEVKKEKLETERREKEINKLNREYEQAKRQRDSLMAAAETQRMEDSLRMEEQKRIEAENARKRALAEAEAAAIRNIGGSYYLSGTVKNNNGGEKYWFSLSLEIYDGNVSGSFETSSNSGPVSGSIDQLGNMKVYELDYDYCQNGYYWTGKFNGKSYKGKYLNYNNSQNMSFWTN